MDLKRLTKVFPLVLFQSVLYLLYIYINKSDVVILPFLPPKNRPWNTSGATEKTQFIATSDVKSIDTNDVKNIATSNIEKITTNDVKSIATSDVEKLRSLLQPQPMIKMLNQSAIQIALSTIKQRDSNYKVPLKIHFIWVGPLFPKEYMVNIESYRVKNPKYDIYLWTDQNDRTIQVGIKKTKVGRIHSLPLLNKCLISLEPNPAAKADMLRYEVIYRHGGIYVDIDSRAEKGFDGNFSHSFLTCNKENRYVIWH